MNALRFRRITTAGVKIAAASLRQLSKATGQKGGGRWEREEWRRTEWQLLRRGVSHLLKRSSHSTQQGSSLINVYAARSALGFRLIPFISCYCFLSRFPVLIARLS
ncbi:hypothetical protein FQA47_012363 [Oryzias melastigma]|uniref:Uncharacterized protein n=1 Tax=Oryzias melastigma TaxID=30732 RepID=A0A834F9I7_ORYME|nr:hypothetical protein FQA47_012363 [Oryzias melastigma]